MGFDGTDPTNDKTKDEFRISASSAPMYGMEIHGHIVENLLGESWIKRFSSRTEFGFVFALLMGATILMMRVGGYRIAYGLGLLTAVLYTCLAYWAFVAKLTFLPGVALFWLLYAAMLAVTTTYFLLTNKRIIAFFECMTRINVAHSTMVRRRSSNRATAFVRENKLRICVVSLALLYWCSPFYGAVENQILRELYAGRGAVAPPNEFVIVSVTNSTLKALSVPPARPFPTKLVEETLQELAKLNPRLVIVDAGLPEDSSDLGLSEALVQTMASVPTVLWDGTSPKGPNERVSDNSVLALLNTKPDVQAAAVIPTPLRFYQVGGVVKELPFMPRAGELPPQLDLASVVVWLCRTTRKTSDETSPPETCAPQQHVGDLINFYGPPGTFERIPMQDILSDRFSNDLQRKLRGKIVFIGYESEDRQRGPVKDDRFLTPVADDPMYGVEINATILANIVNHSALSTPRGVTAAVVAVTLMLLALLPLYFTRWWSTILAFAIGAGAIAIVSRVAFAQLNVMVAGISIFSFASSLSLIFALLRNLLRSAWERRGLARVYSGRVDIGD